MLTDVYRCLQIFPHRSVDLTDDQSPVFLIVTVETSATPGAAAVELLKVRLAEHHIYNNVDARRELELNRFRMRAGHL